MPNIFKVYFRHIAIGAALSAGFVAIILYMNVANLQHLIFSAQNPILPLLLLWVFNTIVFGPVQFAFMVMSKAEYPEDGTPTGGTPIPVRVEARKLPR